MPPAVVHGIGDAPQFDYLHVAAQGVQKVPFGKRQHLILVVHPGKRFGKAQAAPELRMGEAGDAGGAHAPQILGSPIHGLVFQGSPHPFSTGHVFYSFARRRTRLSNQRFRKPAVR
jgi:hypothetical protein